MGQTVNLLLFSFGGSNPSAPTTLISAKNCVAEILHGSFGTSQFDADTRPRAETELCFGFRGNSSVDRALAFQAGGRGFESRFPLQKIFVANVAQW